MHTICRRNICRLNFEDFLSKILSHACCMVSQSRTIYFHLRHWYSAILSNHNMFVQLRQIHPAFRIFFAQLSSQYQRGPASYISICQKTDRNVRQDKSDLCEGESAFLRISPIDDTSPWPDTSLMRLQLATMHILTFYKGLHSNCTLEEVSVSSHPPRAEQSVPVPLLHIQPFPSRSQGCCYCSSPLQPLLLHVWLRGDLPREDYVPVGGGEHQGSHCQPAAQHGPRTLTGEGCWA